MTVHRAAADGFGRGAEVYERARPSYPRAAVELLVDVLGLRPGRTLVELGAGTGKVTRLLATSGARVVAVEPVAAMRAVLAGAAPGVEAVEGTAEAIPVGDGGADGVVAAQAFHWFDGDAALAEIGRVLRPGGTLALVWNVRDRNEPWMEEVGRIIERYRGDTPTHYSGRWREAFERTGAFTPLEQRTVPNPHLTDRTGFVERFLSVSMVAALPDDERAHVGDELAAVVAGFDEPFELPQQTVVYWCSRR